MRSSCVLSLIFALALPRESWGTTSVSIWPSTANPNSSSESEHEGKPTIHLDRLIFPRDIVDASSFEKHLRRVLRREAYLADWGAGKDNRIEYRFQVDTLKYAVDGRALRIRCEATGRLPGGQTAKSELTFGGDIGSRKLLTRQVLEIVGRGVIYRLAELERRRRGLE